MLPSIYKLISPQRLLFSSRLGQRGEEPWCWLFSGALAMRSGDCSGDGAGDFWRWRWRYVSVHSGDFFFHSGDLRSGDYKKKNSKAVGEFLKLRPLALIQTNAMRVQEEVMHKVGFGCAVSGQKNLRMLFIRELDRKRGSADPGSDESHQIVSCLRFLSYRHQ